jgi:hypothetical protein
MRDGSALAGWKVEKTLECSKLNFLVYGEDQPKEYIHRRRVPVAEVRSVPDSTRRSGSSTFLKSPWTLIWIRVYTVNPTDSHPVCSHWGVDMKVEIVEVRKREKKRRGGWKVQVCWD